MDGHSLALTEMRPVVPRGRDEAMLAFGERGDHCERRVRLTHLQKIFWPEPRLTKGMLVQYYLDVADVLLPHLVGRAMAVKRWPNGAMGKYFVMKRAPVPRPSWIRTFAVGPVSSDPVELPVVEDLASLIWLVNLACIELNPWHAPCRDDVRLEQHTLPDCLRFNLDVGTARFHDVLEAALVLRTALGAMGMPAYVKTSGLNGLHVYVPIIRGPTPEETWTASREIALDVAQRHPTLVTAEHRAGRRPVGRVLLDCRPNVLGFALPSPYSARPTPGGAVSLPLTWAEVEQGTATDDCPMDRAALRIRRRGDLWAPLAREGAERFDLRRLGRSRP